MEASLERLIVFFLHESTEAQTLAAIAANTDCSVDEATKVVRDLIRLRRVERHHVGPGELRYSLQEDFTAATYRPGRAVPKKRDVDGAPKQQRILELLGDRCMTAAMLADMSGDLTQTQVSNLILVLRMKGLVEQDGQRPSPRWHAVGPRPVLADDDELPPCVGEKMRQTTHDIHRAAAEAAHEDMPHE